MTRWRDDATCDSGGVSLYIRDVRAGTVWSAGYQPTRHEPDDYLVTCRSDRVSIHRRDGDLATALDIAVSTEDDVEVRRLTLTNQGDRARELEVTSYVEIVLAPPAEDFSHPAFAKLFLETEYLPDSTALVCHRRQRELSERPAWAVHVLGLDRGVQGPVEWETDRAAFLGRGRTVHDPGGARRPPALTHGRRRPRSNSEPADNACVSRQARSSACVSRSASPATARAPRRWRAGITIRGRRRARWRWRSPTRSTR